MARYRVTYVHSTGELRYLRFDYAPSPHILYIRTLPLQFNSARTLPRFVMRYYPSKQRWRVFDLTQPRTVSSYQGQPRFTLPQVFEHPDEDAAVMWALLGGDNNG